MRPALTTTRRILLMAAATLPAAGCGAKLYGVDLHTWGDAVEISTGLKDQPGITLDQASKVPYSSLGYRVGSSAQNMLVLATSNSNELLWTSSQHLTLVTRGGRIVKSVRFPLNLSDSRFPAFDPAADFLQPLPRQAVPRLCDFQDINLYDVLITGQFEASGSETITILGQSLPTLVIVEHCRSDKLDWDFQNTYWTDAKSGFVWQSEQTIHPKLDPLTIEIFRPPA